MSATPSSPIAGTQLLAASRASLTMRLPDGRVRTLVLSREPLTIGRHPTNQLVVDVPTVSAEHAVIAYRAGVYHLVDRGSRNCTFINGQRIDEIDLNDGDLIRLGETDSSAVTLTYRAGQAPQGAAFDQFDLAAHDTLTIGRANECDLVQLQSWKPCSGTYRTRRQAVRVVESVFRLVTRNGDADMLAKCYRPARRGG